MTQERLSFVFQVMLYVGFGLPLLNVLFGLVGGLFNGFADIDTDVSADSDLDIDGELDVDTDFDFDAATDGLGEAPSQAVELEVAEGNVGSPSESHGVFVRFNVYCICLSLVVMGSIGVFAVQSLTGVTQLLVIGLGGGLAVAAYVLLYRFVIYPLKKNDAKALQNKRLRFKHAIVTFRVKSDSPGKIKTIDAVGATITYRAELDKDITKVDKIDEGEEVVITDLNEAEGLCYVIPAQHSILHGGKI